MFLQKSLPTDSSSSTLTPWITPQRARISRRCRSMRTTISLLRRLALPILVALGSTIVVNPILAAEPNEELKAIRDLLKRIDERLENSNTASVLMLEKQKADFNQLKQELAQLRDELSQARRDMADVKNRTL